jgi:hypothetical protein
MKHEQKLSQEQQQEIAAQLQQRAGHEFTTAEEMLRFDAAQTIVPKGIEERLKASSADIAPLRRSWWKNLFGK